MEKFEFDKKGESLTNEAFECVLNVLCASDFRNF